jgi:hypothetical protein
MGSFSSQMSQWTREDKFIGVDGVIVALNKEGVHTPFQGNGTSIN